LQPTVTPDALGRPPPAEGVKDRTRWFEPSRGWAKAGIASELRGIESE
jgi:hypothetical protein